jgi:cytochrome b
LGHNPLGALSVLGLLGLVGLQVSSGLFASNDDTGYAGPFYALISNHFGSLATSLHHQAFDILVILIGLHIAAIMYYGHVKKDKLLKPMITGHKQVGSGHSAEGGGLVAFVIALVIACGVVYAASGEWIEKPAPTAQETPAW